MLLNIVSAYFFANFSHLIISLAFDVNNFLNQVTGVSLKGFSI